MSKDEPYEGFNQGSDMVFFSSFHYHSISVLTKKAELE